MAEKFKETWYFLEPSEEEDDFHFFKRQVEGDDKAYYALWRIPEGLEPDIEGYDNLYGISFMGVYTENDVMHEADEEHPATNFIIKAYNQLDAIDRLRIYHNILLQKPIDKDWYEEKPA